MQATLQIEKREGVAIVRLDRPDKRNALSFPMMRELVATARALGRDRGLRAVVLTGNGASFCAGLDVAELGNRGNRWFVFKELLKPRQSLFQRMCTAWRALPVPVVAAVHGHCLGGGLQLALAADLRFACGDSQWSVMESRWGMVPDMGITVTLRGLVRPDVAKELVWSAHVLDGAEAARLGLVTHLAEDPLDAALGWAGALSACSPDAVLAGKRIVDAMHDASAWRTLWLEKWWQLKLLAGRNSAIARRRAKHPDTPWLPRRHR